MTDLARLVIAADSTGLRRALHDMVRLEVQSGRTEKAARQLGNGMGALSSRLVALGAGFLSLRGAMSLMDEFTSLSNSLRIVSEDGTSVSDRLREIADIASRTRSPISGVAQVYQRASMAAQDLGASQKDLLRFTENIGLALGQTGQSGAAATGALLQLSQALGGGTVRAEEFNSILEGAYPIAQAAARGIEEAGGSVARLRSLVIEGKVSSDEFFRAILSQTDELEAAFASTIPTIGQAFTVLRNELMMSVGQFDQTIGISQALASALILVAGEMDRVVSYVAAGVLALAGYQAALIAATVATGGLAAASIALRTALMRTGFGLIVVALGEMIYRLTQAAEKVGGFGVLFGIFKDVAVEALSRIGMGWDYVHAMAVAAAAGMHRAFLGAIGRIGAAFADLTWTIAEGMNSLFGLSLSGMAFNPGSNPEFFGALNEASATAEEAAARVSEIATQIQAPLESLGRLNQALQGELASTGDAATDTATSLDALGDAASGGNGGAAGAMDRALTATEAFNKGMQEAAMTAEDLGTAKANALVGGIEGISQAFGTFVSTGLRDFKGFVRSVLSSFQRMIADMIATAAQNKILLSLGFAAPSGASAATGAISGGGGFMSMLSGVGGAMFSGATSWLGGIGSGLSALSGATSGLTGFATALGAIAAPLAALGLVFSAFRGSTKLVDQGFRLMADGADLLVTQFKETEKRRFFGLVKKKKTTEGAASDEIADPLQAAYSDVQGTILDMADSLGKGSSALKNFSYTVKLSTKGMSNDEAAQALANELEKMSDEMAKAVLGGTKFVRSGETTTEALKRLSGSLSAANAAMKALGLPLFKVSVSGAAAASAMVDVLGGIEGFNRATAFYLQNFYSLEEQRNAMSREFAAAVKDMGLAVPKTKEEFKALVDELTKAGRMEDAATLIGLAPLFVDLQTLRDRIKELGDASTLSSEELAKLNKAESEKDSLQRRYLELTGQTAKLRKLELAELEPANRALQERIWAIEDEQRVEAERGDLQRRIYELTGNTAALRKLELAALDPANRALQRQVWALEDAQKALDDLTTDGFGSLFEYERAVGLAKGNMAQIGAGAGNVLEMVANAIGSFMTGPGRGSSSFPTRPPIETRGANKASAPAREQKRAGAYDNDAMLIELRAIKTLHSAVLQRVTALDLKIRKWDGDGLPETRTA